MGSRLPWTSKALGDVGGGGRLDAAQPQCGVLQLPNGSLWLFADGSPAAADDTVCVKFQCTQATGNTFGDMPIVWRVSRPVLVRKLALLTGEPTAADLTFTFSLKPDCPRSALVQSLLDSLLAAIAVAQELATSVVVAELEQALITAFLDASLYDWQQSAAEQSRGAAPWQVHRAEAYIEQNWDKSISIDDLADETGASPRSIFRAFQQSRGYTPLEYARAVRLRHARRLLESAGCTSVTEAAFACGFNDLGRFSKDFVQAFGERPSVVLARRKSSF